MGSISITIEGRAVEATAGTSILRAALDAGVYIPHLCSHPDLPPFDSSRPSDAIFRGGELIDGAAGAEGGFPEDGCGLCAVGVAGRDGYVRACDAEVAEGLVAVVDSPELVSYRRERLARILATHPHACLTCPQREGCSRTQCSANVPEEERCCGRFGRCEIRKVAEFVGIPPDLPRYVHRGLPIVDDEPLIRYDYNLCIDCTRCVRACQGLYGEASVGYIRTEVGVIVGRLGASHSESGCRLCGACVEVCPAGALEDKEIRWATREEELVPCASTCPVGLDVPEYTRRIAEGDFRGAAQIIRDGTPLASVLGVACFRPCEEVCRRGRVSEPMAICALKRAAMEHTDGPPAAESATPAPTGRHVAIVGAGPAGLAAAHYLAGKGHRVTLLEAMDEPGGMMRYGIPRYRLPLDLLASDIEEILSNGMIEVRTKVRVGDTVAFEELRRSHDAVLVATGTQRGRALEVDGIEAEGVREGLDFLREVALGAVPGDLFEGERVVVIGGGDVAIDVARTALRLGADRVDLVCLESRGEMPAHGREVADAEVEGVRLHPSLGPARLLSEGGRISGVELKRCTAVFDERGRFDPRFDEERRETLPADAVIVAIGQVADLSFLGDLRREFPADGGASLEGGASPAAAEGVFFAGDVATGPTSIVGSIASGRRAAAEVDRFLGGDGVVGPRRGRERHGPVGGRRRVAGFVDLGRVPMPRLDPESRLEGFETVERGYDPESAMAEAARCLGCDLRFRFSDVVLPPEPWLEFTESVVDTVPAEAGVYQLLDERREILSIAGTPDLRKSLREKLEADPNARYFLYERDPMYTKRESELIQEYLQRHGKMPGGGEDDLDDLF